MDLLVREAEPADAGSVASLLTDLGYPVSSEFAAERLARYKLPRRLEIVAALPRNPAGKVLKFELRARFGGTDRSIG